MTRRELMLLFTGAAGSFSLAAGAQQAALPLIGFIGLRSAAQSVRFVDAFRRGLGEEGLEEGRSVKVEYRWTEGDMGRIAQFVSELIQLRPAVVYTFAFGPADLKPITDAGIPLVFSTAVDPVAGGLVSSFARPGGRLTGVQLFVSDLSPKRLSILHQLSPRATAVGALVNPKNLDAEVLRAEIHAAAEKLGITVIFFEAASQTDIDDAYGRMAKSSIGALCEMPDPLFAANREIVVARANALALPAIYEDREFAEAGGLISYGDDFMDIYRLIGNQVGKIVKGADPGNLPVLRSTKFETVLNLKTAKSLGLEIPTILLASVDTVIE